MEAHLLELWEKLGTWFFNYSPKILTALVIVVIGLRVAKWISVLISKAATKSSPEQATCVKFIKDIVYYLLLVLVFITALSQLGVSTTSFIAVLGTLGLAVGLAFKDSLGNFASGVLMVLSHHISQGDFINIGGESGYVTAIGIMNTTIITPDNKKIIIPNSAIMNGNVYNFTANPTRRVDVITKISYGDDIKTARAAVKEVAEADSRILKDPAPVMVVTQLADNGVEISSRMWCKTTDYWTVYWDMNEKIKEALQKAGIAIHVASPVHVIMDKDK